MTRIVLLESRLGDKVHVRAGASTIEAATGLTSDQIAALTDDDCDAILRAMRR